MTRRGVRLVGALVDGSDEGGWTDRYACGRGVNN
jgi:hypothetical protein